MYGFDFVPSSLIKDNPDLVKRFVAAYREAFDFSVQHPDEAATITANQFTAEKSMSFPLLMQAVRLSLF